MLLPVHVDQGLNRQYDIHEGLTFIYHSFLGGQQCIKYECYEPVLLGDEWTMFTQVKAKTKKKKNALRENQIRRHEFRGGKDCFSLKSTRLTHRRVSDVFTELWKQVDPKQAGIVVRAECKGGHGARVCMFTPAHRHTHTHTRRGNAESLRIHTALFVPSPRKVTTDACNPDHPQLTHFGYNAREQSQAIFVVCFSSH